MTSLIGFSGSLRKDSYNTTLLRTGSKLLPEGTSLHIYSLSQLPLYNDDLALNNTNPHVPSFRESIEKADGILIASPEYNYSFSGVLKNALDWASTDTLGNVLMGKPTAIMGASRSIFDYVSSFL